LLPTRYKMQLWRTVCNPEYGRASLRWWGLSAPGCSVSITYIRITAGFVYLAMILDAWSRRVIGYTHGRQIDTRLALAALRAAINTRQPPPGCIRRARQLAADCFPPVDVVFATPTDVARRPAPSDPLSILGSGVTVYARLST